jgi:hypothetical protein
MVRRVHFSQKHGDGPPSPILRAEGVVTIPAPSEWKRMNTADKLEPLTHRWKDPDAGVVLLHGECVLCVCYDSYVVGVESRAKTVSQIGFANCLLVCSQRECVLHMPGV